MVPRNAAFLLSIRRTVRRTNKLLASEFPQVVQQSRPSTCQPTRPLARLALITNLPSRLKASLLVAPGQPAWFRKPSMLGIHFHGARKTVGLRGFHFLYGSIFAATEVGLYVFVGGLISRSAQSTRWILNPVPLRCQCAVAALQVLVKDGFSENQYCCGMVMKLGLNWQHCSQQVLRPWNT